MFNSRLLRVRSFLLGMLFLVIPLTFVWQQQQEGHLYMLNLNQHVPRLNKELFGIAAGDSMQMINNNELNRYLDDYKMLGAQWIRFDFDWAEIQSDGITTYNWSKNDAAVKAANARGIKVLGVVSYTPQWQLPSGCINKYGCPPNNSTDYAQFAATVAKRYAPMGVHYWEIWNEPNGKAFTAAAYTSLLKSAYTAIKQVDPTAFILAGGSNGELTRGKKISPTDFLTGIYQNGGKGYFDALAYHPYCFSGQFNCPTAYADWSGWSQMQDTNPSLRSIMIANGDQDKKIWATEFGAPTGGSKQAVSEAQQAQMVTDAYTLFASYSWAGPLFWHTYRDPCSRAKNIECFFGLVRNDYSHKPAYAAYQSLATNATPTS